MDKTVLETFVWPGKCMCYGSVFKTSMRKRNAIQSIIIKKELLVFLVSLEYQVYCIVN